ncbi:hypothetical protein Droror1_Dr00011790 [Drosera rotundifolia]
MATISLTHHFHCAIKQYKQTSIPTIQATLSCKNNKPSKNTGSDTERGDEIKRPRSSSSRRGLFFGIVGMVKGLKESMSPKQKGDWKDLVLMSLSFAVYVYMSQKIVCAYCAWMSLIN